jgi:hypothetical protein
MNKASKNILQVLNFCHYHRQKESGGNMDAEI